jgi:hypothetical protein
MKNKTNFFTQMINFPKSFKSVKYSYSMINIIGNMGNKEENQKQDDKQTSKNKHKK